MAISRLYYPCKPILIHPVVSDPTEYGLIRAVLELPDEDLPRLVLADYWQENAQEERAEYTRLGIEIGRLQAVRAAFVKSVGGVEVIRQSELGDWKRRRDKELTAPMMPLFDRSGDLYRDEWFQPVKDSRIVAEVRRGFVCGVTMSEEDFEAHRHWLFRSQPVVNVRFSHWATKPTSQFHVINEMLAKDSFTKSCVTRA